jgi:hypothetical protein
MADLKRDDEKQLPVAGGYTADISDSDEEGVTFEKLIAEDHDHDIKLRTMSWQKAAWLLAVSQVYP